MKTIFLFFINFHKNRHRVELKSSSQIAFESHFKNNSFRKLHGNCFTSLQMNKWVEGLNWKICCSWWQIKHIILMCHFNVELPYRTTFLITFSAFEETVCPLKWRRARKKTNIYAKFLKSPKPDQILFHPTFRPYFLVRKTPPFPHIHSSDSSQN